MFFQSKKRRLWRARVPLPVPDSQSLNRPICPKEYSQKCAHCMENHYQDISPTATNQHASSCQQLYSGSYSNICDGREMYGRENTTHGCYCGNGTSISDYDDDQTMPITKSGSSTSVSPMKVSGTTTANVFRNCCGGRNQPSDNNNGEDRTCMKLNEQKEMFRALIGKLKESQLATLCQAIENGHASDVQQPDCVLVPRGTIMGEEPNVIAARIWRWPDLKSAAELKSIPSCPSEKDPVYVCCNPSHWNRLCTAETPPPPYQLIALDRLNSEDCPRVQLQFSESLTTDGEDSSSKSWCQLAYWELAQRVGDKFPVENGSVNIFSGQQRGDGLCLKILAEQRKSATPESVLKAREKIGLGVTLSQEADGVWLYNRSSVPVFVHSPTLNDPDYRFNVFKVPPGYCLRAFDNYMANSKFLTWPSQIAGAQTGPVDMNSMRISFAKGWGPNYTRQEITACPCWLEVLFPRR